MKKLLGILVLGLLWCNVANASLIDFEKCYKNEVISAIVTYDPDSVDQEWNSKSWEDHQWHYAFKENTPDEIMLLWMNRRMGKDLTAEEKTKVEKYRIAIPYVEDYIFSIDTQNGIVTSIWTARDEWIKYNKDQFLKIKKERGHNLPFRGTKYNTDEFKITNYSSKIVLGHRIERWDLGDASINKTIEEHLTIDLDKAYIEIQRKEVPDDTYNQTTTENTYKILCQSKETSIAGKGGASGTAFFISNKGYLLTNNHVVEGCKVSKIIYKNEEHDTSLISTDKTLDLALLKSKVKPKSHISFSKDEPKKRQQIIVAGYPLGKGLSDDLKINDGRISALKGYENNSNEITVDVAINPGNSGGPIINQKGHLVAIAVAGMSKDVTEGINFGIKASAAANFLKLNKISPSAGYMSFSMDDDKLVKLLEESTVYTFCN